MKRRNHIALAGLLVLGASGWFLLSTVLLDELPDEVLVLAAALASLATLAALGVPSRADLKRLGGAQLAWSALAGVLMLAVSPLVILANRFTDAPPGSETLFLTTSAWAATRSARLGIPAEAAGERCVRSRLCAHGRRRRGCLARELGAAQLLLSVHSLSLTRPCVSCCGGHLAGRRMMLIRSRSQHDTHPAQVVAAAAGAGAAFIALALSGKLATISQIPSYAGVLLAASVLSSAVFVGWLVLADAWALRRRAPCGCCPRGYNRLRGLRAGVQPSRALIRSCGRVPGRHHAGRSRCPGRLAFERRWFACAGSSSSPIRRPVLPPLSSRLRLSERLPWSPRTSRDRATVKGSLTSGQAYSAQWNLLGFETAGGWAAVVAGGLLISSALDALSTRRLGRYPRIRSGCAVVLGAYYYLASTPLHTWTRWVP